MAAALEQAGCTDVTVETLSLTPVDATCALGRKRSA